VQRSNETNRHFRLSGFDYWQSGAYFVTICSAQRRCLFGEISDFRMEANADAQLVVACWLRLSNDYPFVSLDSRVLIPNHLHGIIWLGSDNSSQKPLSQIVAAFKATSTSRVRKAFGSNTELWQRGFFEHIIRDDDDLFRIREYIDGTPTGWGLDPENSSSKTDHLYVTALLACGAGACYAGACNAPLTEYRHRRTLSQKCLTHIPLAGALHLDQYASGKPSLCRKEFLAPAQPK
jgi:putative transposase